MIATEAPGLRVSCTIWRFCSIDRNCRRRTPAPRTSLITLLRTLVVSTRTPHVDTTKCPLPSWAHHVSVWFSGGGGPDTTLTYDHDASAENIRNRLALIAASTRESDLVVLLLSGHGSIVPGQEM